jgi:alkaline phosphatase D
MVLWTRLATAPLDIGGGMGSTNVSIAWEVATDSAFSNIVASGTETAVPSEGHSVHAEPHGLASGAWFYYRFKANGFVSPVGRTRTAPAAGSTPSSVKFVFASCQHFEEGWYHAHRYMAADDPDLVLFLGDYMYEKQSGSSTRVRWYVDFDEVDYLDEYRLRYSQHHTDPDLVAVRAKAPMVAVFDDHELANNWWGAGADWPASRKQAAFQAFWENMPVPKAMKPVSSAIPLYRRIGWGTLATFHMMDTRQYRWKQAPAGDCTEITRTDRTLTGSTQEQWLLDGLGASTARWNLLGQQVFYAQRDTDGSSSTCDVSTDAWDGYRAGRNRITQGWVDRGVRNPVVLTGDVHRHWANNLRLNYFDQSSPYVGAELVTSSITSGGDGADSTPPGMSNNPHLNYIGNHRGYVRVTANATQLTADFQKVSSVTTRDAAGVTLSTVRRYAVQDGIPGLHQI